VEPFILNEDSLYFAQLGTESWYRIPHNMVEDFLRSNAHVKELRPGVSWSSVSRIETQPLDAAPDES
jgi:hypothetical protein